MSFYLQNNISSTREKDEVSKLYTFYLLNYRVFYVKNERRDLTSCHNTRKDTLFTPDSITYPIRFNYLPSIHHNSLSISIPIIVIYERNTQKPYSLLYFTREIYTFIQLYYIQLREKHTLFITQE